MGERSVALLLDKLADAIGRASAAELRARFAADPRFGDDRMRSLATLLVSAYPAIGPAIAGKPDDLAWLAKTGQRAKDAKALRRAALEACGDLSDTESVRRSLRVFARREKLRIALRELLPGAAYDVDVTARELSDLADVCTELALREALAWADRRFGVPKTATGERCAFVVIGMGKLGGREAKAR